MMQNRLISTFIALTLFLCAAERVRAAGVHWGRHLHRCRSHRKEGRQADSAFPYDGLERVGPQNGN